MLAGLFLWKNGENDMLKESGKVECCLIFGCGTHLFRVAYIYDEIIRSH
jgi:hypothetical protein